MGMFMGRKPGTMSKQEMSRFEAGAREVEEEALLVLTFGVVMFMCESSRDLEEVDWVGGTRVKAVLTK